MGLAVRCLKMAPLSSLMVLQVKLSMYVTGRIENLPGLGNSLVFVCAKVGSRAIFLSVKRFPWTKKSETDYPIFR
jgi:hypothetical protein